MIGIHSRMPLWRHSSESRDFVQEVNLPKA